MCVQGVLRLIWKFARRQRCRWYYPRRSQWLPPNAWPILQDVLLFLQTFCPSMALFGVRGFKKWSWAIGLRPVVMSPYRAICTHFRPNSINYLKKDLGPGPGSGPGPRPAPGPGPGPGPGHFFEENHRIGSEMDPYGSVWAHIKTGRSPMAQDFSKPLLTPKSTVKRPNT